MEFHNEWGRDCGTERYSISSNRRNYSKSEQDQSETKYTFSVQVLELYQNQLIDLLQRDKKDGNDSLKLKISQDAHGVITVVNATKISCKTKEDMFQAIELAIQTRHVSSTAMNKSSSRSPFDYIHFH